MTRSFRHSPFTHKLVCIPCLDGDHALCKVQWAYELNPPHRPATYVCICACRRRPVR